MTAKIVPAGIQEKRAEMTEKDNTPKDVPHSWGSSKLWIGTFVWCVLVAISGAALFTGVATFKEWSWFTGLGTPATLGLIYVVLHMDKRQRASVLRAVLEKLPGGKDGTS